MTEDYIIREMARFEGHVVNLKRNKVLRAAVMIDNCMTGLTHDECIQAIAIAVAVIADDVAESTVITIPDATATVVVDQAAS